LPYSSPHRIRDTISALGKKICRNMEEWEAWSRNMGHAYVATTMNSYGRVSGDRQAELIRGLAAAGKRSKADVAAEIAALAQVLQTAE